MNTANLFRNISNVSRIVTHPIVPPDLIFFVTSRCNAKCHFCLFHDQVHDRDRKASEMSLDEIEQFAKNYGRLTKFSLSGGEPFIRHDIAKIVKIFNKHTQPAIIDIPTNGFYVERIKSRVREMLDYTVDNEPVLEVQLSIDGPKEIHEKIRQVEGIFDKVLETYWVLDEIRQKNPRLRIKMNLTYVIENSDAVIRLTEEFDKKYKFDRYQITFPHGAKATEDIIPDLAYRKYLEQSREILKHSAIRNKWDMHSLVFRAIKMIKDDVLFDVMRKGDMGIRCKAGRRILAVDERGQVYPCEPLWESVGSLRDSGYKILPILQSQAYRNFQKKYLGRGKCNCTWGNVMLNSVAFNPVYFPKIIRNMAMLMTAGGKGITNSTSNLVQESLTKDDDFTQVPSREDLLLKAGFVCRQ